MIAAMLRRSPPEERYLLPHHKEDQIREDDVVEVTGDEDEDGNEEDDLSRLSTNEPRPLLSRWGAEEDETSPLMVSRSRESRRSYGISNGRNGSVDLESQKGPSRTGWLHRTIDSVKGGRGKVARGFKSWDRHALWKNVVVAPVACLPAVVVGLLLNILDALSYGEDCGYPILCGIVTNSYQV